MCEGFRKQGYNLKILEYDAGHHCWGHENLNWAFKRARGKLINICDDDDVWMPDAAQSIRNAGLKYPGIPLLFRFKTFYGSVLWDQAGLIDRGHIGGHCLVQPNIPGKIGRMDCAYAGDFELIDSCIKLHGGAAAWVDKIIAVARPIDG